MYLDNPFMYLEDLFESCLYGDTPAGRDTIGAKENILSFGRGHFLDYLNTQYSSDKIIVSLAGRLGPGAPGLVKKYFGGLAKKNYRDKLKTDDHQSSSRF